MNSEPSESDDGSSEKIENVNILTQGLKTLNIKPDCDERDSHEDSATPSYTNRGPIGGKPSKYQYSTTDKPLPMPPMPNNFGAGQNYMAYHAQMQKPGRRMPEEPSQQPYKYTRPQPQPEMTQQQFAPVLQKNQFAIQPNFCTNLSQPSNSGQQNSFSNPPQMFNFGVNSTTAATVMSQIRLTRSSTGDIVKVQSPVSNVQDTFANTDGNMVDAFLDGLNIPGFSQLTDNVAVRSVANQPPCSVQAGRINNTYSRKTLTETRRCSDQDSGFESAEEKSPNSVQTPIPASAVCTSRPSVDSAFRLSPICETFPENKGYAPDGMSSPQYSDMQSPASHRTTPSPGSTLGYERPLAPQHCEEVFNEKRITDLSDVLDVIGHDLTSNENVDQNLRKSIKSQQMEISKLAHNKQSVAPVAPMTDLYRVNRPLKVSLQTQQNVIPVSAEQIPTSVLSQTARTVPDQPVHVAATIPAIPAASSQSPNIIICIVPVSSPQQKQKKQGRRKPRPILPKIPEIPASNNNTTNASSVMTRTCPSNKTDITMAMLNNIVQFEHGSEDLRIKLRERQL